MAIQKLQFVPGDREASLAVATHPWFKHPGVYVQDGRDGNVYYVVSESCSPRRVEKDVAERAALAALAPEQQAAHESLLAAQAREAARADGFEASPLDGVLYPTALDCLTACGAEFDVVPDTIYRRKADGTFLAIPGWRHIFRPDRETTLHCVTDAYEAVPQRDPLSMLDGMARQGAVLYRHAWESTERMRVRPVGDETGTNVRIDGRRVGIRFDVPSVETRAFDGRVKAGGSLVTSHDGSTAIRATACLTFASITIFNVDVRSWRHSSKVAARLSQSKEAFAYLVRAARGLVRDAEATVNVPDDEAADVVLRAMEPVLFEAPPVGSLPDDERAAIIRSRAEKVTAARLRLHTRARTITAEHPDVFLGGFRYVLAAPSAFSNRTISAASYYDGLARDRMTTALIALARHAGMVNAGVVPEGPVVIPEMSAPAEPASAPSAPACGECGGSGVGDDGFVCGCVAATEGASA